MKTRIKLMDSAEKLARKHGYDGFSYADLAQEVGIRKASIHHHFPTKADLAYAVMQRYRNVFFEALADVVAEKGKASECLRAYVDLYRQASHDGSTLCLCVSFSISRESLHREVLDEIERFHEDSISWLQALFLLAKTDQSIAGVGDPLEEACACLALVEGAQLIARLVGSAASYDRAVVQLESRLL